MGKDAEAVPVLEEALGLSQQADDFICQADALFMLAQHKMDVQDFSVARNMLEKARELNVQSGRITGVLLAKLSSVAQRQGKMDETDKYAQEALEVAEKHADAYELACAELQLGDIALARAQYDQAIKHMEHARDNCLDINDQRGLAHSIQLLGQIELARGNYQSAAEVLEQAQRIYSQIGDKPGLTRISTMVDAIKARSRPLPLTRDNDRRGRFRGRFH